MIVLCIQITYHVIQTFRRLRSICIHSFRNHSDHVCFLRTSHEIEIITRDYVRSIVGQTRSRIYRNVTRAPRCAVRLFAVSNSRNEERRKKNTASRFNHYHSRGRMEAQTAINPPTFEYLRISIDGIQFRQL